MSVKISQLPEASVLDGTEEIAIVQEGETRKATSGAVGLGDALPIGTIFSHAGTVAPAGSLICDGAEISRTLYADLFDAIGTTWGVGDGATTFNIPDLRGAFLRGTGSHGSETMADGNPFAGPAVGAFEDDQLQGHEHTVQGQLLTPTGGSTYRNLGGAGTSNLDTIALVTDGVNGTPRDGDETRPFAAGIVYCIKATKAVNVPDISTIESFRFDSGWVTAADLTDATINIQHDLDAPLAELIVHVFVKRDAGSIDPTEISNITAESGVLAANSQWGIEILEVDNDNITLQTGANGILLLDNTGSVVGIADGEYRIVIYKPTVVAGFLPTTLTTWRFSTGWVANSDWTDMTLDVVHNLGASLPDLIVRVFVSGTENDDAAIELINHTRTDGSGTSPNLGYQLQGVDENTIRFQSGADGLVYFNSVGSMIGLDTEAWFYKFVIYRPEIIQQVVSATTYDFAISAEDKSIVLPSAYSLNTDLTISWSGGDGTYTLSIDPDTGQTIDGDAAGVWKGQGEGRMIVQRVSATLWQVRQYYDTSGGVDFGGGANSTGYFSKEASGKMEQWGVCDVAILAISTAMLGGFRSSGVTITYPLSFTAEPESFQACGANTLTFGVGINPAGGSEDTDCIMVFQAVTSQTGSQRTARWKATGHWK